MRLWWLLVLFLSAQVFGQSVPLSTALSLNPPPSDSSVIFLGNIFGVVDGVLSGTGSQIFGHMMQVFNAAILGLGSIIIMYTLIVGTLNTAQEGEFLGRQWSSVWIPVRCTTGLALLIPKATGYSLIQIFILWVIVQGVGAGDKIWTAALEYLNMGGKIIQAQQSSKDLINKTDPGQSTNDVFYGASVILMGQVCMYGLQKIYESAQQYYKELANQQSSTSPCAGSPKTSESYAFKIGEIAVTATRNWSMFCSGTIPDFVSTVDINKAVKDAEANGQSPIVPMPNFPNGDWTFLNGYCGTLKWNLMNDDELNNYKTHFKLSGSDMSSLKNSRPIALQTMYSNLASVAYAMVSNNAAFSTTQDSNATFPQFGVPLNSNDAECEGPADSCQDWGALPSDPDTPKLFAGNEFVNGIGAYAGIMMPVLNLKYQHMFKDFYKKAKQFIDETERTGWIFAGAYFFKLVNLSGSPKEQAFSRDTESGLDNSIQFGLDSTKYSTLMKDSSLNTDTILRTLAYLVPSDNAYPLSFTDAIISLRSLIWGASGDMSVSNTYTQNIGYVGGYTLNTKNDENSVLGFIRNSSMLDVGGQPGIKGVKSIKLPKMLTAVKPFKMPGLKKGCYGKIDIKLIGLRICLFNGVADLLWAIISAVLNALAMVAYALLWIITQILIVAPILMVIVPMINTAFKVINNMSLSPIIDLANLGAYFIQNTLYGYMTMFAVSVIAVYFPVAFIGQIIQMMLAFMMPFYMAWLTYFLSIGFTTLFYVPMVPYIIFIFGAVAWIFLVIEAVLAGPLVALLMTSPEGEGLLGNKGEQGLILLVNLFLRPSLMIIGFITGIALSYVNIWMLNESYSIAADYIRSPPDRSRDFARGWRNIAKDYKHNETFGNCHRREYQKLHKTRMNDIEKNEKAGDTCEQKMAAAAGIVGPSEQGVEWDKYPFASLLGMIFYLVLYISMYTTMVQKGFQLIALLPDKVIRWVGGSESAGQETLRWEGEVAAQMNKANEAASKSIEGGLGELTAHIDSMVKPQQKGGDGAGSTKAGPDAGPGGQSTPPP